MSAGAEKSSDKKLFRFTDLAMTFVFVVLGIFFIYVVILLLGIWEFPILPRQIFAP